MKAASEPEAPATRQRTERAKAAHRLAPAERPLLPQPGTTSARLAAASSAAAAIGPHVAEVVQARLTPTSGFEPRELSKVASGGELSRVMLALKTILARLDAVPTLVFDEIDAGIGGRVAVEVGQQLREVAAHHQVFVISHLPQIASRAAHH